MYCQSLHQSNNTFSLTHSSARAQCEIYRRLSSRVTFILAPTCGRQGGVIAHRRELQTVHASSSFLELDDVLSSTPHSLTRRSSLNLLQGHRRTHFHGNAFNRDTSADTEWQCSVEEDRGGEAIWSVSLLLSYPGTKFRYLH